MGVKDILVYIVLLMLAVSVIIALIKIAFQLIIAVLSKTGILTSIFPVGYYFFCNEFAEKWVSEHHTLWLIILIVLIALTMFSIIGSAVINFQSLKSSLKNTKRT